MPPTSMMVEYSNWRRGFDKRSALKKMRDMNFVTGNGLHENDLEDTIDKASMLLMPYRGRIARIELIKNTIASLLLIVFCIVAVVVGLQTG